MKGFLNMNPKHKHQKIQLWLSGAPRLFMQKFHLVFIMDLL